MTSPFKMQGNIIKMRFVKNIHADIKKTHVHVGKVLTTFSLITDPPGLWFNQKLEKNNYTASCWLYIFVLFCILMQICHGNMAGSTFTYKNQMCIISQNCAN